MGNKQEEVEFDWITLHDQMGLMGTETTKDKFIRKMKENPFVPIGCLATTAALGYGIWSFSSGNTKMSQMMMRTRVAAQGFTIVALLVGLGLSIKDKK
ncbi:HIG1 domain family member 2A, mitochondrial [Onthophagus taurus]|uniref:HIG1 domain family member 2A, mitochondrial n=1 Tax=Onthophagus taurus TaxID=166361 RepID=UPI000C20BFC8|nr:HIG1 domain family member 2A, mitochondrial [Onthophagus taurus]